MSDLAPFRAPAPPALWRGGPQSLTTPNTATLTPELAVNVQAVEPNETKREAAKTWLLHLLEDLPKPKAGMGRRPTAKELSLPEVDEFKKYCPLVSNKYILNTTRVVAYYPTNNLYNPPVERRFQAEYNPKDDTFYYTNLAYPFERTDIQPTNDGKTSMVNKGGGELWLRHVDEVNPDTHLPPSWHPDKVPFGAPGEPNDLPNGGALVFAAIATGADPTSATLIRGQTASLQAPLSWTGVPVLDGLSAEHSRPVGSVSPGRQLAIFYLPNAVILDELVDKLESDVHIDAGFEFEVYSKGKSVPAKRSGKELVALIDSNGHINASSVVLAGGKYLQDFTAVYAATSRPWYRRLAFFDFA